VIVKPSGGGDPRCRRPESSGTGRRPPSGGFPQTAALPRVRRERSTEPDSDVRYNPGLLALCVKPNPKRRGCGP
jgi:hypothetical protein